MHWHKVELTEEIVREGMLAQIQNEFMNMLLTEPDMRREVLLYRQQHAADSGETVYFYLESETFAEDLRELFSLSPCNPPSIPPKGDAVSKRHLTLLAGDVSLDERVRDGLLEDKDMK